MNCTLLRCTCVVQYRTVQCCRRGDVIPAANIHHANEGARYAQETTKISRGARNESQRPQTTDIYCTKCIENMIHAYRVVRYKKTHEERAWGRCMVDGASVPHGPPIKYRIYDHQYDCYRSGGSAVYTSTVQVVPHKSSCCIILYSTILV